MSSDDGRMTQCLICEAPMYRWEVKRHDRACAAIHDGLEALCEQAVKDLEEQQAGWRGRKR